MSNSKRTRAGRELASVAEQAASCTGCDLYRDATQTVFGEGPVPAPLMIHPASIVRLQERAERHAELDALVKDLELAAHDML